MPLHSRSPTRNALQSRFRNARVVRAPLRPEFGEPGPVSERRRADASGARRCGGRTEQSAPPRRIFLVHDDEKRVARDRHWQPVKFGDPCLAPRVDGVGFPRAPSLEFLLVHHSEVKPGGADARFRRARMIPRCGPGGSRCPSPISN
jgi:hypothetical protein